MLLELRVCSADSYNTTIFWGIRDCLSSTLSTFALLLAATLSVGFVKSEADLTLCVFQVLKHVRQVLAWSIALRPSIIEQHLIWLFRKIAAFSEGGQDVRLPNMLTEVWTNWVHDSKDSLDVSEDYIGVLFATFSNQIAFLDIKEMIEYNNNILYSHLCIALVSLSNSLVYFICEQIVPEVVLRSVILREVKAILRYVILDPFLQNEELHDSLVGHFLIKVSIVKRISSIGKGNSTGI